MKQKNNNVMPDHNNNHAAMHEHLWLNRGIDQEGPDQEDESSIDHNNNHAAIHEPIHVGVSKNHHGWH